jgi:hypothetical protein
MWFRALAHALLPATAFLASSLPLPADVLLLADGRKFAGDVSEKKETWTIRVEGQELVFGKDEVKAVCRAPADFIGDRAADLAAAKSIYQEALPLADLSAQGAKMKEALARANRARAAYSEARALFAEDRYADLDQSLVQISQLLRLIRERIGSGVMASTSAAPAKPAAVPAKPVPVPVPDKPAPEPSALAKAFEVLADPAKRGDAAARAAAEEAFAGAKGGGPLGDLAASARLFLAREKDLLPEAAAALQEHFRKQGIAGAATFPAARQLEAAKALADPVKALAGKGAEALQPFAAGHLAAALGGAPAVPAADVEAVARELGFRKSEYRDLWGTPEGLAAEDARYWASQDQFDMGVAQLRKDFAAGRDFGVAALIAWLQMQDAFEKKQSYRRAYAAWVALAALPGTSAQKANATAVAEALRKRLPCTACGGTHSVRCPLCRGKKKVNVMCPRCEGSGKLFTIRGTFPCTACKSQGMFKDVDCTKCKTTGEVECKAAYCRQAVSPPTFEELYEAPPCAACAGTGVATRKVVTRCPSCLGLGVRLAPKGESAKAPE